MSHVPVLLAVLAACGGSMIAVPKTHPPGEPPELPVERNSPAEILAATHAFVIEITALEPGTWRPSPPFEERPLQIGATLLQRLKGPLALGPGASFRASVRQEREGGGVVSDFHGVWSHAKVSVGERLAVLAVAETDNPAALLQNEALLRDGFWPADRSADFQLAREGEQLRRDRLENPDGGTREERELAAASALLALTETHRAKVHGLYGRWLKLRIARVLVQSRDRPLAAVARLVESEEAPLELRQTMAALLFDVADAHRGQPDVFQPTARALFAPLDSERTPASFKGWLVQAQLYGLAFPASGVPGPAAADVFVLQERARFARALDGIGGEAASQLQAWLSR